MSTLLFCLLFLGHIVLERIAFAGLFIIFTLVLLLFIVVTFFFINDSLFLIHLCGCLSGSVRWLLTCLGSGPLTFQVRASSFPGEELLLPYLAGKITSHRLFNCLVVAELHFKILFLIALLVCFEPSLGLSSMS